MDLLLNVSWTPIIIGAVAAYVLGGVWYAQAVFGKAWMAGINIDPSRKCPPALPMIAQAGATFLLSWLVGIAAAQNSWQFALLIALTCAGLIKANGLFASKGYTAIVIETGFVFAMVLVMWLAHWVM